ncbi:tyrosine-type recombinase/integrase [Streptomyces sp. S186]|uniref:tyrosine-type recombinase/integrase n=1 Tax=Streptomyces sp. S186 TaxID=3434395 RepID=UPI003F67F165
MLSVEHIRALLGWVQEHTEVPGAVFPFLASMVGAALLPGEAAAVRVDDAELPEGEFGALLVRAGEVRKVPVTPELAGVLREWIGKAGLEPGDLLFPGERGGSLSSSVYRRVWKQARQAVLSPGDVEARLGEHVTGLRDSCLDLWLKKGVPVWVVAEWAGVSASSLALRYPHRFRLEDVELDWGHLAEVMALPGSSKRVDPGPRSAAAQSRG